MDGIGPSGRVTSSAGESLSRRPAESAHGAQQPGDRVHDQQGGEAEREADDCRVHRLEPSAGAEGGIDARAVLVLPEGDDVADDATGERHEEPAPPHGREPTPVAIHGDVDINGDLVDELRGRLLSCIGPHRSADVDPDEHVDLVLILLEASGAMP